MRAPFVQWLVRSARLLVLVGLAGCAETASLAPASAAGDRAAPEDDLWAMVPAEADLVLFADLAKLRESPWSKDSFDKVAPADGAAADPALDQVRGMDRVMFAKVPSLRDGASVLVAQGEVGREGMRRGFEASGGQAERSTYRGAELWVRGDEALAFLGRRTVLSGFVLAVRAALDCNAGIARGIESEAWLREIRNQLEPKVSTQDLVASLYLHLQPATREALLREMGEGGSIEDFGGRIDLGADLDATAVAVVGTEMQARDLAARLAERIREVRRRPVVAAFGLGSVLDSLALAAKGNRVHAKVHVSEKERSEISARMTMVTEILTKMRARQEDDGKVNQENQQR
jgi:hypothetical protein